jgi:hypothetical protein
MGKSAILRRADRAGRSSCRASGVPRLPPPRPAAAVESPPPPRSATDSSSAPAASRPASRTCWDSQSGRAAVGEHADTCRNASGRSIRGQHRGCHGDAALCHDAHDRRASDRRCVGTAIGMVRAAVERTAETRRRPNSTAHPARPYTRPTPGLIRGTAGSTEPSRCNEKALSVTRRAQGRHQERRCVAGCHVDAKRQRAGWSMLRCVLPYLLVL